MGQALPQTPIETPAPANPQPATPKPAANDNIPRPRAANDNYPQANTRGRIRTTPRTSLRGNLLYEGLKLAGRILFDPNVFGDHNDYFADTPTFNEEERALVNQGNQDIRVGGQNPAEVRARVRREIRERREKEAEEKKKAEAKKKAENVEVEGDECKALASQIYKRAAEVKGRFTDLMADKFDLYNVARSSPSPSLPKGSGSWDGHVHQLEGQQQGLRNDLKAYDNKPCYQPPIPQSIRDMSKMQIPDRPGGTPGYPLTAVPG